MPIYEYRCNKCEHEFELLQKMSAPAEADCPKCGGHARRLISPSGFVLKGAGFYVNDYPSESRRKAVSKEMKGNGKHTETKTDKSEKTEKAEKKEKVA